MTFLQIAFLGGMAAVAVPIVLHLVMRQQPKLFEFPALRLVRQRKESNRRRMRLRHLLLLLLRAAAICLLALALARPSMQASGMLGDAEAPVAAALVFDTSPRLDYKLANKTRLDEARETALWLLAQLPPDSEAAVVDRQSRATVFAAELGAARQRINRLTTSAVGPQLPGLVEDALRLLSTSEKQRKELYVFSDLSRGGWPVATSDAWRKLIDAAGNVSIHVIDVGASEPRNFAITSPRLSSDVLATGTPLRVQCEAQRLAPADSAAEDERTVELYLLDDKQQPVKRAQEVARFGPGDSQTVDFRIASLESGLHQGYIKLAGEDNLPCDDTRFFTVLVRPAWKVLLAAPADPSDYALFLREALAPYPLRIKGEAAFACDVVPLDQLASTKLEDYSAVCLLDPTPLDESTWQQLASFASGGGGVAIFLGRNATPIAKFNTAATDRVLPAKLLRQWRSGPGGVFLAPTNLEHPLLRKFRSLETAIPWDGFPVFRHWELGPLAEGSVPVISFSNTLPAVVERPLGRGRVLTMTTPVSDSANRRDLWNTLPTGDEPWPFVMLAGEMLRYLVGSDEARLNYLAGETAVVPLPAELTGVVSLATPRGDMVRQAVEDARGALVFAATDVAGNYRAALGPNFGDQSVGFSVNLSAEASELARVTPVELEERFAPQKIRIARNRDEIDRSINTARVGVELYPHLMLLLALVLVAEQLLSNRFYRGRGNLDGVDEATALAREMAKSQAIPHDAATPAVAAQTQAAPEPARPRGTLP
jgi:hypothetical protein